MADQETKQEISTTAEHQPPAYNTEQSNDQNFVQQEPMKYETPTQEVNPEMVTPLARLGQQSANVDCPYCKAVRRTLPREEATGNDDMVKCLICLVCWPILCCYESEKELRHECSVCHRQLTRQALPSGAVQVVADMNPQPAQVPSRFGTAS